MFFPYESIPITSILNTNFLLTINDITVIPIWIGVIHCLQVISH
jgi:hypothetical protein